MTTAAESPERAAGRDAHAPAFSIVVPTLNEVENVDELLRQIFALDDAGGPFEVVVVDDASSDGTVERVLAWAETRPVRLVQRQRSPRSRERRDRGRARGARRRRCRDGRRPLASGARDSRPGAAGARQPRRRGDRQPARPGRVDSGLAAAAPARLAVRVGARVADQRGARSAVGILRDPARGAARARRCAAGLQDPARGARERRQPAARDRGADRVRGPCVRAVQARPRHGTPVSAPARGPSRLRARLARVPVACAPRSPSVRSRTRSSSRCSRAPARSSRPHSSRAPRRRCSRPPPCARAICSAAASRGDRRSRRGFAWPGSRCSQHSCAAACWRRSCARGSRRSLRSCPRWPRVSRCSGSARGRSSSLRRSPRASGRSRCASASSRSRRTCSRCASPTWARSSCCPRRRTTGATRSTWRCPIWTTRRWSPG